MKAFSERMAGRDSVSGHIVEFGMLGLIPTDEGSELLRIKFSIDSGCSVFSIMSREQLEKVMERKARAATFVGEFVDGNPKNLFCEEVYFWEASDQG